MDINPEPRCGWPDTPCKAGREAHEPPVAGRRRAWTYHDVQCPVLNPRPGSHLDGYPVCSFVAGHEGPCDYIRHAAEKL